jgi:hypothetical protein
MKTQLIKPETKKELVALVFSNRVKSKFSKEELVMRFTNGRTDSMSAMYEAEAINLHKFVKALMAELNTANSSVDDERRKKILSHAHAMGWRLDNGKVDLDRIDEWLLSDKSPFKKRLNELTSAELSKVIHITGKMKTEHLKQTYGRVSN